jgi:hypothetical protein
MLPEELSDRLWAFAARIGKVVDVLGKSVSTAKADSQHPRKDLIYQ